MFRYIGFIWNESNPTQVETVRLLSSRLSHRSAWRRPVQWPGVRLFFSNSTSARGPVLIHPLHDQAGIILGTLFSGGRDRAVQSIASDFDRATSRAILDTHGHALIERYWGNYIAILPNDSTSSALLLRGPMGSLPCYVLVFRGVHVCFSHLEDCRTLGIPLSINWDYVICKLRFRGQPSTADTGIAGVTAVRAGECVEIRPDRVERSFYWNPLEIAASEPVEDPAAAAEAVRQLTRACVNAWTSHHAAILHLLSGGIDSSIVLACLSDVPTKLRITCLNYYSAGSNTDEREFARAAAQRAGCELIERRRDSEVNLEPLLDIPVTSPTPAFYIGYIEKSRSEMSLAAKYGATAICSGVGGDQLFYQANPALAVSDYLHDHGVRPALLGVAYDAARREKRTIWNVLYAAAVGQLKRHRWNPDGELPRERRLLTEQAFQREYAREAFIHPWFLSANDTPSGKLYHAYSLTVPQPFYYDPFGSMDDPEELAPLYSQPLVELCLRIPTYIHTAGGWDRSVARHAFESRVPEQIIWRRTKGGMEEHMRDMLLRNLPIIRPLLLEGELGKRGLIDLDRVSAFLSADTSREVGSLGEVFEYASLEAWLRSISSIPHAAAAA